MIVPDVADVVVRAYRARRATLLHDALQADAHRRPIAAGRARAARRILARAIRAERHGDPTGLGS